MSLPEPFEALLAQEPSAMVFEALCSQADGADLSADAVAAIGERLAAWPKEVRRPLPEARFGRLLSEGGDARVAWADSRVENEPVFAEDVRRLAASPWVAGFRKLVLDTSEMGPAGAVALAGSPHLRHLEELSLLFGNIGDEGVAALAASPVLDRLVELRLALNKIGPAGAEALAQSPHVESLRVLFLGADPIGDAGTLALAQGRFRLGKLALDDCGVGDAGARALAESPALADLRWLNLEKNALSAEGVKTIEARFAGIDMLNLEGNPGGSG